LLPYRSIGALYLTGSANKADDGIVGQSSRATDTPQTTPFTVGLQHLANLFSTDMTAVVETIEGFGKSLMASRTEIALMTLRHLAMFVSFSVTAQRAFHHLASS
jgi:hypothetical protein